MSITWCRHICWLGWLIAVCVPAPCRAQPAEQLAAAVLGLRGPPGQVDALTHLTEQLSQSIERQGVRAPGLDELRERRDLTLHSGWEERIERRREQAREAGMSFRFADATLSLEQARRLFDLALADLLEDPEYVQVVLDLAQAQLNEAIHYQQAGQPGLAESSENDVRQNLTELILTHPSAEPDPRNYSPQLIVVFEQIRTAALQTGQHLEAPRTGRLYLAGMSLGLTYVLSGTVSATTTGALEVHLVVMDCRTGDAALLQPLLLSPGGEWAASLDEALEDAVQREEASLLPETSSFFVMSSPPGASITVDGQRQSVVTPSEVTVAPGLHRLMLTLDGYETAELIVRAWLNQTRPVEVQLTPARRSSSVTRSWWFWTIVGIGAASAIAGIAVGVTQATR